MKILAYSPKVEAYATVGQSGEVIDLTPDLSDMRVERKQDATSEFSATLLNNGHKYNGVFSCFDRIAIFVTKTERTKLFTGYITDFDSFRLYQTDFNISGHCSLYRLQKLYFDPGLWESQKLWVGNMNNLYEQDAGYANIAKRLLVNIGGWDRGKIDIQSEMPKSVIDWAEQLYKSKFDETEQLKSWLNEFYEVLQTHGPKGSVGGTGTYTGTSDGEVRPYEGIDFDMPEKQFVKKWGTRINEYYAGHYPNGDLNGHGETIAREARRNGCDPRIIVAISVGETGGGDGPAKSGIHGIHNYWSWGCYPGSESIAPDVGIWSDTIDGAIAEFCQKFAQRYAGKSPAECAELGYGEVDYILSVWQPVIDAI